MMNNFKYLQKLDMFGNKIELSYYKEKTHKTKFGGFLTLLLIIFSCMAINYFGQEIINKSDPNVTTEESYLKDSYIRNICFNHPETGAIMFALRVLDYQQKNVKNQDIYVTGLVYEKQITSEGDIQQDGQKNQMNLEIQMRKVELEIIPCTEYEKMYNEILNRDEFDFDSLICFQIKRGQLNEDSGLYKFELLINLNQNSSLERGILEIYQTELALDLSSYQNPGVNYLNKRIFSFEKGAERRLPIKIKKVVLETDQGIVLSLYQQSVFLIPRIYGEIQQISDYIDDSRKNSIFTIEFQMDRKYQLTRRSYQKLQDFLSSVGGIIKVFSMVFIFLSKKLTKLDFYTNLLNQIFNFEDPNEECFKHPIEDDDSEDDDELNQFQDNLQVVNQQNNLNINKNDFGVNKIQESKNTQMGQIQFEQKQKHVQDIEKGILDKKRRISLDIEKNPLKENIKSETAIFPNGQMSYYNRESQQNFATILQNTETLIPLQLLSNKNNHDENCRMSPKNGSSEEKEKNQNEKQQDSIQKSNNIDQDQIKIDLQILQDLEDSDDKGSNLKKQVRKLDKYQKNAKEVDHISKDEVIDDSGQQNCEESQDFNKRRGNFRRRNAIPKNTMLISKFMHKVRSLLNNEEPDTQKIETIKKKLNHQGSTYIQPENKPLKWGFFDYIQNLFCFGKARQKRQQMKYCWKKVKERLNAVYIMQKLVELEKLKILLLDEHQLKLFDYLPKPMISLNVVATDLQSGQTSSIMRSSIRKSNEQNFSPDNPVNTPVNPVNTPTQNNPEETPNNPEDTPNNPEDTPSNPLITKINNIPTNNIENKEEHIKINIEGLNNNNNCHNENPSSKLNERQNSSKSNSPKKNTKYLNCFGLLSGQSKKNKKQRSMSTVKDKSFKQNGNDSPALGGNKTTQKNQHSFHQQWIQLNSRSTPLEKALHAMEAFEFIKNKQTKSAIDIKLVDMLDSRMKKCFENANDQDICDEENVQDGNMSQFRQLFDGDNTIREFLYPSEQYQQPIRNNRRARTVAITSSPRNISQGNSLSNHNNYPSNNNSFNQSFMPFNNLNNLLNANYNGYTPARRNFNILPSMNSQYNNHQTNQYNDNAESQLDFSRYMNDFYQIQNHKISKHHPRISQTPNNKLQVQNRRIINKQGSFSPSGYMQSQLKKKNARQLNPFSLANKLPNNNICNINNKNPNISSFNYNVSNSINNNVDNNPNFAGQSNIKGSNNKPSIFLRRLQTYDNCIYDDVIKYKSSDLQKNYYGNNQTQQQQQLQSSFTSSNNQINSETSSKKRHKGSEISSPQKFELDLSSLNDSNNHAANMHNPQIQNLRPSHQSHSLHANIAQKNLNISGIDSDLNTIEEDIPQENNTPTTISKMSHINESHLRKQNTSFQQCMNISQSQASPFKVTDALKKYSISFQTMMQDLQK